MENLLVVVLILGVIAFVITCLAKNWKYLGNDTLEQRDAWIKENIDFEPGLPEIQTDPVINNPYFETEPPAEEILSNDTNKKQVSSKIFKGDLRKGDHVKVIKKKGPDIRATFLSYSGHRKIVKYFGGGIFRRTNVVRA